MGIYIKQIKEQASEAESCFELIQRNPDSHSVVFSAAHHFLVHVSNIFKIVQPDYKLETDFKKIRMDSILKELPGLPKISPKDILVRNDLEHFDTRIDDWVENSTKRNYADRNIGPVSAIVGLDIKDNFRWFDPTTMILYFWGQPYDLKSLYGYVKEVQKATLSK